MAKENRSSNTEMVSVPRHTLENVLKDGSCKAEVHASFLQARNDIEQLLGRPAQQHHGEPVTLPARKSEPTELSDVFVDAGNESWNACLDEIAKLGPLYTHPAPVRGGPVAVLYANGTVLTKEDCGDVFDICCKVETPLYTHTDPAEVERLRDDLDECDGDRWKLRTERNTLRAQLAEAHALLREVHESGALYPEDHQPTAKIQALDDRIAAALSASAEPQVKS